VGLRFPNDPPVIVTFLSPYTLLELQELRPALNPCPNSESFYIAAPTRTSTVC
jgi:hypothetical protein